MVQIQVRNFRSIRDSTIELRPGLNVLIGPNGWGKTNLLAALKFIRDVLTSGVALAMGKAGGPPHNFYRGCRQFGVPCLGTTTTSCCVAGGCKRPRSCESRRNSSCDNA
jgi:predicted ATPase